MKQIIVKSPTAGQHVFLADTLIITDSSGNTIYDSTLEEKKKGHIHAELMAQYAEDAKTTDKPWKLWQFKVDDGVWCDCPRSPHWRVTTEYRRKPKTHIVNGVEIPDLRVTPEHGDCYYIADPTLPGLTELYQFVMSMEKLWVERGLTYQHTKEGKQAAILHAKAMLGIA